MIDDVEHAAEPAIGDDRGGGLGIADQAGGGEDGDEAGEFGHGGFPACLVRHLCHVLCLDMTMGYDDIGSAENHIL